jgi:uncharacterized protein
MDKKIRNTLIASGAILVIVTGLLYPGGLFTMIESLRQWISGNNERRDAVSKGINSDYSVFDRPEISLYLFHPRAEDGGSSVMKNVYNLEIPVDEGIFVGARFFSHGKVSPTILFFHGNGEIVDDYTDIGSMFTRLGINFFPVDYRGYGRSNGSPTVSSMMNDGHVIYRYARDWLKKNGYTGRFLVMGRSLGSAPAIDLASSHNSEIDGLIIESGFALTLPLLRLLGVNIGDLGVREEDSPGNINKIKKVTVPTLVIHAERDHIIPFSDGQALYASCAAKQKKFLAIPEANHNTIFAYGLDDYLEAVRNIALK